MKQGQAAWPRAWRIEGGGWTCVCQRFQLVPDESVSCGEGLKEERMAVLARPGTMARAGDSYRPSFFTREVRGIGAFTHIPRCLVHTPKPPFTLDASSARPWRRS